MSQRVSASEFAKIANVNKSTVSRWIKSGRIKLGGDGKIDAQEGLRQREMTESPLPHHQAAKEQIDDQKASSLNIDLSGLDLSMTESLGLELKLATLRDRKAKAAMGEIELDKAAGLLVERTEVDFILKDLGLVISEKLRSLPDRYASAMAAHRGDVNAIHKEFEDLIHDALTDISEDLNRKADQL